MATISGQTVVRDRKGKGRKMDKVKLLEDMLRIRRFEEEVDRLYFAGKLPGQPHSCTGQEATAVGVCAALEPDDLLASNHRGEGHLIARGVDLYRLFAEVLGRRDGYSRGKGGAFHVADLSIGILGTTGIVGAGLPIAVGAGLAAQMRGSNQIVVAFFGDGASNQGAFHEALNLAGLWKLPVLFACENNLYGFSVAQSRHQAVKDVAMRAQSYGFQGEVVDGNAVLDVWEAARRAVARIRAGEGPFLLEMKTYRWAGHFGADPGTSYRPPEEVEHWKQRCPVKLYKEILLRTGGISEDGLEELEDRVTREVDGASRRAQECPEPPLEAAQEDLFLEIQP